MGMAVTAGSYVLGELLGRGGMGEVYAALQPSLGRAVAVKLLHPQLATDPSFVDRFRTEALAGSRLSHPNAAGVIDFGAADDGTPFLVMEHVPGERLACILEREGALPAERACVLVGQILAALDAAHAVGVVHADVKCDNVLVDAARDGSELATLIDFGIARLADREATTDAQVGIVAGTPEYLAPEVIHGEPPTPASDLYAAGVVLYELLTGATPFRGGAPEAILHRHLEDEVVAPSLRCPDAEISPALERVVLRALAKDPAMRYASAVEFAAALAAVTPTATRVRARACGRVGFSTEAPTRDWPVAPRRQSERRMACGTRPQPLERTAQFRSAIDPTGLRPAPPGKPSGSPTPRFASLIGSAIAVGDTDEIANSYLALARSLVGEWNLSLAARELEQAVDVLTAGAGAETAAPPPSLWRVLLALAAVYDGLGDPVRSRATTRRAQSAAIYVHCATGRDRARALLQRLVRGVAA